MRKFFDSIDRLADTNRENKIGCWLERTAFVFLILMVVSAPHSIAATQTSWLLGMTAWLASFIFKPRRKYVKTPLDVPLLAFFGWTAITSIFSYAPDISIDKLRGALLFLIFFFVVNNLRNFRAVKFAAFALVLSCMVGVARSPVEGIFGRGVQISGVRTESLFTKAVHFDHDTYLKARKDKNFSFFSEPFDEKSLGAAELRPIIDGDAIVEANGKTIRTPDELTAEIEKNDATYLECFSPPDYYTRVVKRENLLAGASSIEKLGIADWKHSRNWRYGGFYGQVITYAEVLLQITALAFGLFIAALGRKRIENESVADAEPHKSSKFSNLFAAPVFVLLACLAAMLFTLSTTFTRAAQLALLIAALAIVLANGSRKMFLTTAAIILPLALAGLFLLQQSRRVDFFDQTDKSVVYRQTVYREGFNLWTHDARKFLLGIGMDSTKRFAAEWHLYDDGKLMTSHFHSTPLQLLIERGLPALVLWFWILWIYARTLLRGLKFQIADSRFQIKESSSNLEFEIWNLEFWRRGIILGCFGALNGFFVSSLVNYSLGDGEVAMVFFILMGFGVSLAIRSSHFDFYNETQKEN